MESFHGRVSLGHIPARRRQENSMTGLIAGYLRLVYSSMCRILTVLSENYFTIDVLGKQ